VKTGYKRRCRRGSVERNASKKGLEKKKVREMFKKEGCKGVERAA